MHKVIEKNYDGSSHFFPFFSSGQLFLWQYRKYCHKSKILNSLADCGIGGVFWLSIELWLPRVLWLLWTLSCLIEALWINLELKRSVLVLVCFYNNYGCEKKPLYYLYFPSSNVINCGLIQIINSLKQDLKNIPKKCVSITVCYYMYNIKNQR